ncbi:type IV pilin protein [Endozoicomonas sp. SCSIO W0465]|uniref:type IV pilin protein n=1 Tax=Endozoicomonas sp. SCSIO W0465 TaxID=2918516 RepID=UPI002075B5B6|nr:type IV pilin protein [Endozoicomonas sp. SCSIO W0465]USE37532.1 prepilin-type N-terminal cleavage/methylation domain-containing protein [Endozoicomonas sp. SCSIO W0465]
MNTSEPLIKSHKKGFSLPELIIVVAIISLLAGIVYPTYSQYMYEVRRSDALAALTAAVAAQERWYSVNHTYTDSMDKLGGSGSPEGYYTLSVEVDNSSYTLTATALSNGVQATDSGCTQFTVNHLGVLAPEACWK